MRLIALLATFVMCLTAETAASKLWTELKSRRESLPGAHQEFEVLQTFKTRRGTQSIKREVVIDLSRGQWRERSISGSGGQIRIFDGENLFRMDEGENEYVRGKGRSKGEDPAPSPHELSAPDWPKAHELERRPCQTPGNDHLCVVLEMPLKQWIRPRPGSHSTKLSQGTQRIFIDTETGLLIGSHTVQMIEDDQRGGYLSDLAYSLKGMSYGAPVDASLFRLPSNDLREVKELSRWNAARIRKQLAGKPAPELVATDLHGKAVTLSSFKGKTVLLDFWTTWCPPCRADAPALRELYRKYGDKDLMIVGISVSEDREIVEKFLNEHPFDYPVVLTTENEMPRVYQVGVLPTYIVIDRGGTLSAAVEGDKSFAELRKLLRRAGLENN